MTNGVNGITDAEVKDRLSKAATLIKAAKEADKAAQRLAREAATDEEHALESLDAVFRNPGDTTPDEVHEIFAAAVNAAFDTRTAASRVHDWLLHPVPENPLGLPVTMLLHAADAARDDGDLVRALSLAGVVIRACENSIAALNGVVAAEAKVDRAAKDAKALAEKAR